MVNSPPTGSTASTAMMMKIAYAPWRPTKSVSVVEIEARTRWESIGGGLARSALLPDDSLNEGGRAMVRVRSGVVGHHATRRHGSLTRQGPQQAVLQRRRARGPARRIRQRVGDPLPGRPRAGVPVRRRAPRDRDAPRGRRRWAQRRPRAGG